MVTSLNENVGKVCLTIFDLTLNFTLDQHFSWCFQWTLLSEFQSINLDPKAACLKKCKKAPFHCSKQYKYPSALSSL